MSASRDHRSPRPHTDANAPDERLVEVALSLAARGADAPAAYIVVTDDPRRSVEQRAIEVHSLPLDDPVVGLVGRRVPAEASAVGLAGPSWVHSLDDTRAPVSGAFVHLLTTRGVSVTIVPPARPGDPPQLIGPTAEIQMGRIPDACRRILDLSTAAPPPDTIELLVDDWLERVLSESLVDAGLSWADLLGCHPLLLALGLTAEPWTPSTLSAATQIAGRWVSWQSIRAALMERANEESLYPRDWLEWVDAGMFARWVLEEALPRAVTLEALDRTLPGTVHDRLIATLSLLSTHDAEHLGRR